MMKGVRAYLPPEDGFDGTADELRSASDAFVWTFPDSLSSTQDADSLEIGRLGDPCGGGALPNGEVRLGYPKKVH